MRKPTPPRGLVKHIRIGMTQTTIVMCIIAAIVSLQSSLTSSPSHPNNMAIDERVLTVHMFARSMPETVLRMHSSSRIIRTCVRCTLHNTVSSKSVAAFYFSFPLWCFLLLASMKCSQKVRDCRNTRIPAASFLCIFEDRS